MLLVYVLQLLATRLHKRVLRTAYRRSLDELIAWCDEHKNMSRIQTRRGIELWTTWFFLYLTYVKIEPSNKKLKKDFDKAIWHMSR